MARSSGLVRILVQAQRQTERNRAAQARAQIRAQTEAAKEAERARKALERAQKADEKERARLYTEARKAQVDLQNEQLEQKIQQLKTLLVDALDVDTFIDILSLKQTPQIGYFYPGSLGVAEVPPKLEQYLPPSPSGLQKYLPGAKEKHTQNIASAHMRFQADMEAYTTREFQRQRELAEAKAHYHRQVADEQKKIAAQNAEVENFQKAFTDGSRWAVENYFTMVLDSSSYPANFPQKAKLSYIPESKQLVVEYDLPLFEVVPTVGSYKYVKSKDAVTETQRPLVQRKELYALVVAQITLRSLYELFKADRLNYLDIIVFNGYADTIDKGTGRTSRVCLVTVRTSRDTFTQLDLSKVDPLACLKVLNASVSKSPTELVPVRPVLDLSMLDPRFIEEADILSGLDQRPNLMDLTPSEFESLITNLFQKMGLETRLTRASRDGGVDCVAYDQRPIFGGKVVIQAKLYKDTVGVSAVRDLYGTVLNEGASKGILVTTSGFGKASFEFANGKPLELISGSHLLALLADHAGIEARIVMPSE